MEASSSFDLFLSYNTRDREPVLRVQAALRERGIATFLDCQHLTVGLNWRDEIEVALTKVNSVAVFIGSEGFGRVQRGEKNLALDRQEFAAKAGNKFPVIPILLPGAKPDAVTGFLSQNTWIDLRTGLENAAAMDAIAHAIKGQAPVPQVSPPEPLCPYRGLLAFTEDDAPLFYGRDAFADDLLCKARTLKLIAVVGPSGTGKSSVVQAGLLPRLRRERAPNATWEAIIFRPGNRPFHNLANELVALYETSLSKTEQMLAANKLGEAFANNELPLDAPIGEALKATQWANRLLFIVDQFEELFTLTEEKDRKPFVNLLLNATAIAPLTIVLTLRADFYGKAISVSRELSDAIQQGIVNIGYVKREELRRAIVKPAESVGLQFEDGLVDRILDNLEDEPGNLPLLEFALTELWEKRQGNRVTNQLYEDIGGVGGSLGKRAEEVFTSLSSAQQELALRAFTRLVRVSAASEEGTDTRQRVKLQEFNDATQAVLQSFVKSRLLVTSRNETTNEEIIEVAHEALIRNWDRLQAVVSKDREFLLWRQEFRFLRAKWLRTCEETGNERDGLLSGSDLTKAKGWLKSNVDDLNNEEKSFIHKSEAAAKRPKKWMAVGGGVLLLTVLAVWVWMQWEARPEAQINRIIVAAKALVPEVQSETRMRWFTVLVTNQNLATARAAAQGIANEQARRLEETKILALAGQFEEALVIARSMEAGVTRATALLAVAQAHLASQQLDAARTVVQEALSLSTVIPDKYASQEILRESATMLARLGQPFEAVKVAESIADKSARAVALLAVVQALAAIKQFDEAHNIAQDTIAFARSAQLNNDADQAVIEVAKILAANAPTRVVLTTLRSLDSPEKRIPALLTVVPALLDAKKVEDSRVILQEAIALAGSLPSKESRTKILGDAAKLLVRAGQPQAGVQAAKSIEDAYDRCLYLADVAEALFQVGLKAEAQAVITECVVAAKNLENLTLRTRAITYSCRALVAMGQEQTSKRLIEEIAPQLATLFSIEDRSKAYYFVAKMLAKLGDYQWAREMADHSLHNDQKLAAYSAILEEYFARLRQLVVTQVENRENLSLFFFRRFGSGSSSDWEEDKWLETN